MHSQKCLGKPNDNDITNEAICDQLDAYKGGQIVGIQPTQQSLDIYDREIIAPLIKLLRMLITCGANSNAYV